jgi:hypothetical protein
MAQVASCRNGFAVIGIEDRTPASKSGGSLSHSSQCSPTNHKPAEHIAVSEALTATTAATDCGGPAASAASFAGSPGRGGPGGAFRPGDVNGEHRRKAGGLGGVVFTPQKTLDAWRLRSLTSGWLAADDWHTEAVDAMARAVVSGAECDVVLACGRLGRSRAEAGIGIAETIEDLAALFAALDDSAPPLRFVTSACVGWAEEGLAMHAQGRCEDPLTGLATVPYLRTRLGEIYREADHAGTNPARTHRLVVVQPSGDHARPGGPDQHDGPDHLEGQDPLYGMAQAILLGHDLRAAFPGGDTLCGNPLSAAGAGPAIALVRARDDLPVRYANLRRTVRVRLTCGALIRMAPLPAQLTEALRLVDELAR